MDDEEIDATSELSSAYMDLPGEHLTINQVVAWNMTYFRKAEALTQEQLGEQLGWSKAVVSAAERSWDAKRVRQFTADDVVALAAALDVPIGALFLPPADDGVSVRYLFHPHGEDPDCLDMADLMAMIMPDSSSGSRAMDAYRRRLVGAVRQYMPAMWRDEVDRWRTAMTDAEIDAEEAEELRAEREMLLRIAARHARIIKTYEKAENEAPSTDAAGSPAEGEEP